MATTFSNNSDRVSLKSLRLFLATIFLLTCLPLTSFGQEKSQKQSTLGIAKKQPAEGIRFVELEDGSFMVPYTTTIPGTEIEFSMEPIPGGTFVMGSEDGDDDEQPTFKVKVEPFWMAKYEVTWDEYHRFMEFEQGFKKLGGVRILTDDNMILSLIHI